MPESAPEFSRPTTWDGLVAIADSITGLAEAVRAAAGVEPASPSEPPLTDEYRSEPLQVGTRLTTVSELDECPAGTVIGAVDDEFGYLIARRNHYDLTWDVTGDEDSNRAAELIQRVPTWRIVGYHPKTQEKN